MKILIKKINPKKSVAENIPYRTDKEIGGYWEYDEKKMHYTIGESNHCPCFLDKKVIFHTHVDIYGGRYFVIPDMPSPTDIYTFMFSDANIMWIKSNRVVLRFEKTKASKKIKDKMWEWLLMRQASKKHYKMTENLFYNLIEGVLLKKKVKKGYWHFLWKNICTNVFKLKVDITNSPNIESL